ncbi:hypothetical protein [Roseivirga sp. UBA838]|uniref:hypothetical protein n=1 Tax=Roseivirga sp. UBA838 TaxID=1947393 RepID=UPI00257D0112|nr:hypothetical protein [Roseivirga sp. UBA838]|tara:strand:+ start:11319 stop:11702 length:384 start_codon:yes stop_codon:yes gene_type:complete
MKTNKTHIAKVRAAMQTTREQVQQLLGWDQQAYCDFQFQQYCAFVEKITDGWPQVRNDLMYSPVFRGFWNYEWNIRDQRDWLSFASDCEDYGYKLSEYLFLNDHLRLLQDEDFMRAYNQTLEVIMYE